MIKRIIYIGYMPLDVKTSGDFYMEKLLDAGYKVEYWDCTPLYFKALRAAHLIKADYITTIRTKRQIRSLLRNLGENVIIVPLIDIDMRTVKLFQMISKSKAKMGFFCRPGLPSVINPTTSQARVGIIRRLLRLSVHPIQLWQKVMFRYRRPRLRNFDVAFAAGRLAMNNIRGRCKELVPINHFDYDSFLQTKSVPVLSPLKENNYAVFLDDNFMDNPDLRAFKMGTLSMDYIQSLSKFFDLIEAAGWEVVISIHPRSNYPKGTWGNRKTFGWSARPLVEHCRLALAHNSTTVSFAILYNKPVVFMLTKQILATYPTNVVPSIRVLAGQFGRETFDIDQNQGLPNFELLAVDKEKYQDYIYNYLANPESETHTTLEIFLKWLGNA